MLQGMTQIIETRNCISKTLNMSPDHTSLFCRCFAVASHDAGPIDTAHRWSASTPKAGAIHSETTVAIGVAFQQMSH